jgi:hypothetical protein
MNWLGGSWVCGSFEKQMPCGDGSNKKSKGEDGFWRAKSEEVQSEEERQ